MPVLHCHQGDLEALAGNSEWWNRKPLPIMSSPPLTPLPLSFSHISTYFSFLSSPYTFPQRTATVGWVMWQYDRWDLEISNVCGNREWLPFAALQKFPRRVQGDVEQEFLIKGLYRGAEAKWQMWSSCLAAVFHVSPIPGSRSSKQIEGT